jgi:hypothetical protein
MTNQYKRPAPYDLGPRVTAGRLSPAELATLAAAGAVL